MNRTALRLATKAALLGGGVAPFPTLAKAAVYDSRVDPIDDLTAEQRVPVIIIRTDEDRRMGLWGRASRRVDLRIELSILTARKNDDGSLVTGWPATDAGLEAFLDLLEYQITVALYGDSTWADWWRRLKSNDDEYASTPVFTSPQQGRVRLAVREATLRFNMQTECLPPPLNVADLVLDTNGDPIIPPYGLPAPLVAVFDYIAAHGGGDLKASTAQIRAMLEAQDLPASHAYPLFVSAGAFIPNPSIPPTGEQPFGINLEVGPDSPPGS